MAARSREDRIKGVMAPILTPFDRMLVPDPRRFVAFAKVLLSLEIGLAPFGTTGEGNSLSAEERMSLLEALAAGGIDMARVMPGTGTCSITETARLSAHAVKLGCCGVLMLPPFYYKDVGDDGLFRAYSSVIERVGDNRLKVYLYHFPRHSQTPLSLPLIERLIKEYPRNVVGIKDSSGDLANLDALCRAFPGFDVFSGTERHLLALLRMGGVGTISASANVNGAAMVQLVKTWRDPGAAALQEALSAFRAVLQDFPAIPALKALIARAAGDPAWRVTRPPLMDFSPDAESLLAQKLTSAGFQV